MVILEDFFLCHGLSLLAFLGLADTLDLLSGVFSRDWVLDSLGIRMAFHPQ